MNLGIKLKHQYLRFFTLAILLFVTACKGGEIKTESTETPSAVATPEEEEARNYILVDGSSTIFPISDTIAQSFMEDNPNIQVIVGISSSGAGLKKFCIGDIDIGNASRAMKKSEIDLCQKNEIEFVEIPIAFDAIAVLGHIYNEWSDCLTLEELKKIWQPNDDAAENITQWKQIREDFPEQPLNLYAPNTDSGTYDYFTDAVLGTPGKSRKDFKSSDDDNIIIQDIESDQGSLGFLSFAYYQQNKDFLKLIAIDNGSGQCIEPSQEIVANGNYSPLSRPLFLYVNKNSLEKMPAVKALVDYQMDATNKKVISEAGYVPISGALEVKLKERVQELTTGSVFEGESAVGVKLIDKYFSEKERKKMGDS
ncbi:PstS family phosphate ABC transporter substrate-binding protein [Okeania sp.]|uniref:PstS family phosphate ABC transporter substrate-binding protein n=1 Tax=Okeania sp. TaxID=3100323 RepID=UPI002B4ADFD9|nr:PstS family phosphate ABC transporter substrate-binding protein [Okeania sp.]MEB3340535.1 PstS family phosphate ABC transporter substrate-binding protein [Okeania sp.]